MKRKLFALVLICGLGLAGCNTVQGLGDDIKSVGRAGERAM